MRANAIVERLIEAEDADDMQLMRALADEPFTCKVERDEADRRNLAFYSYLGTGVGADNNTSPKTIRDNLKAFNRLAGRVSFPVNSLMSVWEWYSKNVHMMESVDDVDDPLSYVQGVLHNWNEYPVEAKLRDMGGVPYKTGGRKGDKGRRWNFQYGEWLFTVFVYEDGSQIWNAYYKTPAFDWDSKADQKRGWRFGGGGQPVELAPGYSPSLYFKLLKQMADQNPDVWGTRRIPKMPDPTGHRYQQNFH